VEGYRTSFYQVIAPAGALGPFLAELQNRSYDDSFEGGTAVLSVYEKDGDTLQLLSPSPGDNSILDDPNHQGDIAAAAKLNDPAATPFQQFRIGITRQFLASDVAVTADFDVPTSGTPDLVVEPLNLTANNGKCLSP
jgi:hypothetical protein